MSDIYGRHRKDARQADKRSFSGSKKKLLNYHQWEVRDLKAAGLNPILSAGGSTPAMNHPAMMAGGGDLLGGLSTAMDVARTGISGGKVGPELQLLQAQKKATNAQEQKATNEATYFHGLEQLLRDKMPHDIASAKAQSELTKYQSSIHKAMIPGATALGVVQGTKDYYDALRFQQTTSPYTEPFKNMINLSPGRLLGR